MSVGVPSTKCELWGHTSPGLTWKSARAKKPAEAGLCKGGNPYAAGACATGWAPPSTR